MQHFCNQVHATMQVCTNVCVHNHTNLCHGEWVDQRKNAFVKALKTSFELYSTPEFKELVCPTTHLAAIKSLRTLNKQVTSLPLTSYYCTTSQANV